MSDSREKPQGAADRMLREVGAKQERMLRARREKNGIWSSIAILGVIGWSVSMPTVIGVAVGVWLDRRWPQHFSWALTLLITGLLIGCVSAWFRINEARIKEARIKENR
jgi:ATP synthase protein I